MWIKSESGQLLNLAHARVLEVFPSGDAWQVVAHFVGNEDGGEGVENPLFVPVCAPRTEKEAQHILDRIGGALDGKDNYLDIARIRQ
ncbi:MAG TPA: hypothetical protein VF681_07335 [Abditibacteriaceae bacterium]|jgi:hypothetical protein